MKRAAALVLTLLALGGCALFEKHSAPDVAVAGLRLGKGEGLYQTVLIDLIIANRDAKPLALNGISYSVRVEGRDLASGRSTEPLEVPASASVRYTVPATLNLMNGFGVIRDVFAKPKGRLNYELSATLEPAGLFSIPITVRKADSLNLSQ